ncbi:MAG: GNAT family N-acetyltransferase [Candidatus Spyradocola sp.]
MRRLSGDDEVFERLIGEGDAIVFNLLYLIREYPNALLLTDDTGCIAAQSNENAPLWLYLAQKPEGTLRSELIELICERIKCNPALKVNAQERFAKDVLQEAARISGKALMADMPMTAYACYRVPDMVVTGQAVTPREEHCGIAAKLLQQMVLDINGFRIPDADAAGFAHNAVGNRNVFLWEAGGEITAMAVIAHRTDRYARINTVVTAPEHRGRGYARMLVGHISRELKAQGVTPMLYADARNPASNKAYRNAGFVPCGEITEFGFRSEQKGM